MVWGLKSVQPEMLRRSRIPHTLVGPVARISLRLASGSLQLRPGQVGVALLDAVLVINLSYRPDRLVQFEAEMRRLGMAARRFEAIPNPMGILGCTLSHAACLRMMLEADWSCAMICEDDAIFRVTRQELDVLTQSFLDDSGAEVSCLAFNLQRPPTLRNLFYFRTRETRTAACYLIKRSIAADLLGVFEQGIEGLSQGGDRMLFGIDIIWKRLQSDRIFVVPTVRAVCQAAGYSDIEGQEVSYNV